MDFVYYVIGKLSILVVKLNICVKYFDPLNLFCKKCCSSYVLNSPEEMICIRSCSKSVLCVVGVLEVFLLAGLAG